MPKDPNAPKAPLSAVQFFTRARRAAVKAEYPALKSAEITHKIAAEWRDLPPDRRAPFIEEAAADKARHASEAESYVPPAAYVRPTKGGHRLRKDPAKPKKARTPYIFFAEARRAEQPGRQMGEHSRLIGEQWANLSPACRAPFEALAAADRARHEREMEGYVESDEYRKAREAFVAARKAGKVGKAEGDGGGASVGLVEENRALKRKLAEQDKTLARQVRRPLPTGWGAPRVSWGGSRRGLVAPRLCSGGSWITTCVG